MSKQIKETFQVQGMVCTGCAELVENALNKLDGVSEVHADFSKNLVTVIYDVQRTGFDEMSRAVKTAGYSIRRMAEKNELENNELENKGQKTFSASQFIGIVILILAAFLLIKNTVGFQFIPEITPSMGYGVLFLVGLLTSLHCVAMCGGINMSQCIGGKTETEGWKGTLKPSFLYNFGRVISYTLIGGIIGAVGSVISPGGKARGIIAVLSGVFMVIMGLGMTGLFPWINKITPRMPRSLRRIAGRSGKGKGPFIVGLLNGLMPCGPLQAMQIYALGTGSALVGALSMFFFSLGTLPLMFGLGAVLTLMGSKFTKKMMKVSAVLVVVLGIIMLNRGFALSGFSFLPSASVSLAAGAAGTQEETNAAGTARAQKVADPAGNTGTQKGTDTAADTGAQKITSELGAYGYPDITVQKGKPVIWNLHAAEGKVNGCNRVLVISEYNIQAELKTGDNIIKFTPASTGTLTYSCWMGMQTGQIKIVDQLPDAAAVTADSAKTASNTAAAADSAKTVSNTAVQSQNTTVQAGKSCCSGAGSAGSAGMACCNGSAVTQ